MTCRSYTDARTHAAIKELADHIVSMVLGSCALELMFLTPSWRRLALCRTYRTILFRWRWYQFRRLLGIYVLEEE